MTFGLSSTFEDLHRGTFEECREALLELLRLRQAPARVIGTVRRWRADAPPEPSPHGAFWLVTAGISAAYEIHDERARLSPMDAGWTGPTTHVVTADDVELYRGTFIGAALELSFRFTGLSLGVQALLDPTDSELAEWGDGRHKDPMTAPWLARRLTDAETALARRYRNCARFAERFELDAPTHGDRWELEAGGTVYAVAEVSDEV